MKLSTRPCTSAVATTVSRSRSWAGAGEAASKLASTTRTGAETRTATLVQRGSGGAAGGPISVDAEPRTHLGEISQEGKLVLRREQQEPGLAVAPVVDVQPVQRA